MALYPTKVSAFATKVTALIAAVLISGGCAVSSTEARVLEAASHTLLVGQKSDGYMEALLTGTLTTREDGCIGVQAGESFYLVVWPHGSTLDQDGTTVTANSIRRALGHEVSIGGGHVDGPLEAMFEENCPTTHLADLESVFISSGFDH